MQEPDLVVVMVSNGPGELSTWVNPLTEKLSQYISIQQKSSSAVIRLRLVLVPCPNATGKEKEVAKNWNKFETITSAKDFWKLLINPKKFAFWPSKGVVVFLGGDQFWSVLLAARLNYKNIAYAEWIARWPFWNDRIAAMSPQVKSLLPKKFQKRCNVVGDLMADLKKYSQINSPLPKGQWIAILPGSKKAKLSVGIPFFLEMADHMKKIAPEYNFLIPIAPTTSIEEIKYFSSHDNPIASEYTSGIKTIKHSADSLNCKVLITYCDTKIHLIETNPSYTFLSQCDLAITTIGANTAELGALGVPMIVVLPTQHLNVMEAWDGFFGIIARMPIFKWIFGLALGLWRLRKNKLMAWPNINAKKMIVPERVGNFRPIDIAKEANDWLSSPHRLRGQKEDLKALRGKSGAIELMVKEIINLLSK